MDGQLHSWPQLNGSPNRNVEVDYQAIRLAGGTLPTPRLPPICEFRTFLDLRS